MKKNLSEFNTWDELVRNPQTGLLSWKRLATVICGLNGILIVDFAVYADWSAGRIIALEGAIILLGYALGTSIQKGVELYHARKTKDEDGPLTTPASAGVQPPKEPELMPQETQPNLPDE